MRKHFTHEERCRLKEELDQGITINQIAKNLGKSERTIYYELSKNRNEKTGLYDAMLAQEHYDTKQANKHVPRILEEDKILAEKIAKYILVDNLSPADIVKKLGKAERISVSTIYNAIDEGLIPGVSKKTLRQNVVKMQKDGILRLPKHIVEAAHLKEGTVFEVEISDDDMLVLRRTGADAVRIH